MHTGTLKKLALALTFWLAIHSSSLKAQLVGPYSNSNGSFEVDVDGLLSDTGTFGTGSLSLSGAGTKMFWYPALGAFRAGGVTGTEWDSSNIGNYSLAVGFNTTASAPGATAFDTLTTASGWYSTAFGYASSATNASTFAAGDETLASGNSSTTFGCLSLATGTYSLALGIASTASGYATVASGCGSTASGNYTIASGLFTTASAYGSAAFGVCNVGGGSATTWVDTDPLFEVGNGKPPTPANSYISTPSDALVVYKNGNAILEGTLQVAPGGDIPMYTGE